MGFVIADSVVGQDALNISTISEPNNEYSTMQLSSSSESSSSSSNFISSYNRRDMLDEIEETFNITNLSSINNSFRPSQLDDFFSITLDEFRNLTMNNIADDSSSDENNEDDDAVRFPDEENTQFTENSTASRY